MVEPLNTKAWVLVPVEPTPEMVEAHYQAHAEAETVFADAQLVWAKMLAASPSLPVVDGGELVEKLRMEAQGHAMEARAANATIHEITR